MLVYYSSFDTNCEVWSPQRGLTVLTLIPADYYGTLHNALHSLAGAFRSVKSSLLEVCGKRFSRIAGAKLVFYIGIKKYINYH